MSFEKITFYELKDELIDGGSFLNKPTVHGHRKRVQNGYFETLLKGVMFINGTKSVSCVFGYGSSLCAKNNNGLGFLGSIFNSMDRLC